MLCLITTHCKALYKILASTFPAELVWGKELAPFISPDKVVSLLWSTATVLYNISNSTSAILFSTSVFFSVQNLISYLFTTITIIIILTKLTLLTLLLLITTYTTLNVIWMIRL